MCGFQRSLFILSALYTLVSKVKLQDTLIVRTLLVDSEMSTFTQVPLCSVCEAAMATKISVEKETVLLEFELLIINLSCSLHGVR